MANGARLLFFNPETDYALASGSNYYTPPASVLRMRRNLGCFMACMARKNDLLLLPDDVAQRPLHEMAFAEWVEIFGVRIVTSDKLAHISETVGIRSVMPWGWNSALVHWLVSKGVSKDILPSDEWIANLKPLSHRRITIDFIDQMNALCDLHIARPREFVSVVDALHFYNDIGEVYFKAPWSSSGRGIQHTRDLTPAHIEPWLRGIIRSQGSVMAEKAYDRALDFASEWSVKPECVRFLGWSVFEASTRGKFHHNLIGRDDELLSYLSQYTDLNLLTQIKDAQAEVLNRLVSPAYKGPLGIDMFVSTDGQINPCVEINLRNTMGIAALSIANAAVDREYFELPSFFKWIRSI